MNPSAHPLTHSPTHRPYPGWGGVKRESLAFAFHACWYRSMRDRQSVQYSRAHSPTSPSHSRLDMLPSAVCRRPAKAKKRQPFTRRGIIARSAVASVSHPPPPPSLPSHIHISPHLSSWHAPTCLIKFATHSTAVLLHVCRHART